MCQLMNAYTSDIVAAMADAVIVLDKIGLITSVNPATRRLLGYTDAELIGEPFDVICTDKAAVTRTIHRQLDHSGQELRREECDFVAADGAVIPMGVIGTAVLDDEGFLSAVVLVARNLRETRALIAELERARDEAEHAARAKTRFLATMSHEVRTPMNAVLGLSELLLDSTLDSHQRRLVGTVHSSTRGLLTILDDVLDLSRIEADKIELESIDFDLHSVFASAAGMFCAVAERNRVALGVDIDASVPARAKGDPARLRQVLVNLIGNAVKFTDFGRIDVAVSAAPRSGGVTLEVQVRDTGIGIAADKIDTLFDDFAQGDVSINRSRGGSGLGLAISARLAQLMGGELSVSSELGGGSCFSFTAALDDAETPAIEAPAPALARPAGSGKILLAEDNRVNQMVASLMLERLGYEVEIASDGIEAVAAAALFDFDAILMDCRMPRMDGYEATAVIRASERGRRVPIIALTASVLEAERDKCAAAGMDGFVSKPFELAELADALARPLAVAPAASPDVDETFDTNRLDELRVMDDGDPAFVVEMFESVLSDVETSLSELRAGDVGVVRDIAHSLKSAAGMLGARHVAATLAAIERAAFEADRSIEGLDPLVDRLSASIADARGAFDLYLARPWSCGALARSGQ